jgi:predicted dehydrogenase
MVTDRSEITRRSSLAALGGIALLAQPKRAAGAQSRVRVALCGVRGRGLDHLRNYSKIDNAEIAAICDIDESVSAKCLATMEKMGLTKPKTYVDVRKLLEDKSIDAVSIATPNHWHALIAIWACQAGKDVYVEKPCTHNLWEGRQLVAAAKRYNRIVQHGTQIRSNPVIREAIQKIHDGYLGEVYMARGVCYKWRDTIGHAPVEPVPAGVDYDLWTGPAPVHPFTRNRFHYNWHWNYIYGNGDLGNQGVHQLDMARWGLGAGFPNKISAIGGHFMFDDDQDTPNDLVCAFEFNLPNGKHRLISFEVRHWMTNHEAGLGTPELGSRTGDSNSVGNIFYGSKGFLSTADEDTGTYKVWLGRQQEAQPSVHDGDQTRHFRNFIDCVISRKQGELNAPIEEGHISAGMMHLANASYRLGRTIHFDPETQQAIGDAEANALLRDGPRGYRTPFAIPEKV